MADRIEEPEFDMPITALLLFAAALLSLIGAGLAAWGFFAPIAPWLDGTNGALALLVSAVAFAGSGAFPWVLYRLQQQEHATAEFKAKAGATDTPLSRP
ncbi:MAG: hypothetical protein ACK4JZ_03785 [Hydrogenophilus thermoluteolus]|uniref:hypothetical protein n=1 Tax=Hydrogenophilus thermoluteolus TaxID=297 RepID=UPI00309A95C2